MANPIYLTQEAYGQWDKTDVVAPGVNDDETGGYYIGYKWLQDDGSLWQCTDATTGAAVWEVDSSYTGRIINGWQYLLQTFFDYLNLLFSADDAYTSNTISISGNTLNDSASSFSLVDGDYFILAGSTYNDGYYQALSATAATITAFYDFLRDEAAGNYMTINPITVDPGLQHIMGRMNAYDVWERPKIQGLSSESGAGYSYSPESTTTIGGLQYPTSITAALRQWKRPSYI